MTAPPGPDHVVLLDDGKHIADKWYSSVIEVKVLVGMAENERKKQK